VDAKRHGQCALEFVELVYEAVVEPDSWNVFLEQVSAALGGAAIQLSLRLPDVLPTADAYFHVGLDEAYHGIFLKHALEGLPWGSIDDDVFRGRFGLASEVVQRSEIADTPFYRDFMRPQGLASEWPICNLIHTEEGQPISGMAIYRREGGREIGADDLALLDALAPHLARAYAIHCQLARVRQERKALTEVIDRLPLGVIFLDADKRVILMNRSVEEILALDDGFRLERDRPVLDNARENQVLQACLGAAVKVQPKSGSSAGDVLSVTRPSGKRPFPLMVGPLLAAHPDSSIDDAKAIIFISDPEGGRITTTEVLETLYQLTHAEAELVRLIAAGHSLEEVAAERGVTMNTVRSQLKQVFSKTDTSRQGELVHLVLTGVASIRNGDAS
jgi:DNA-binding CsgD family transcriptional regulator/PAS domain-containing protein